MLARLHLQWEVARFGLDRYSLFKVAGRMCWAPAVAVRYVVCYICLFETIITWPVKCLLCMKLEQLVKILGIFLHNNQIIIELSDNNIVCTYFFVTFKIFFYFMPNRHTRILCIIHNSVFVQIAQIAAGSGIVQFVNA